MLSFKIKPYQILSLCIFLNVALHAGWNEDFDEQTKRMQEQLAPLQNADYVDTYKFFKKVRAKLLNDNELVQKIQNWKMDDKLMISKKDLNIIIKKRRNNKMHDLYPWELSYLTNSNAYILPSFPIEIGGKIVILQKLESFQVGSIDMGNDPMAIDKVSLKTYWRALLQAYILGIGDLVSPNIGISDKGIIRFFDNESCLVYHNTPFRCADTFRMGFVCQAIDWPQYRIPMDANTAKIVQEYVNSFCNNFEENMNIYLAFRPVDVITEGLQVRIDKLRSFEFSEGKTFDDFHEFIYPRLNKGLDQLSKIVSNILKVDGGRGMSLFFVIRRMKKYPLTPEENATIQKWIDRYVGHRKHAG